MAQKWNLGDIRPAGTQQRSAPAREVGERPRAKQDIAPRAPRIETPPPAFDDSDLSAIDIIDGNEVKKKKAVITSVVVALIVVTGIFMNLLLGGAEVTIFPKVRDVSVQSDFTIHKEPKVGELSYELLTLEATGEYQVEASGKEPVSERAEGKIFVYNTKSTSPQRLIKNTRFEKDGLIFRIKESIEVPGVTKDAKGNTVPGSVVADVFADATGEKYNIKPGKFTVPGLKDTDQYDSVYGESTVAFTGGFEGEKYIIDEQELNTAKQTLHIDLRDKLLARLNEEKPAGFIVYDGAVTFVYETLPSTEYGDSLATIKEKAKLHVPMFKESEFAAYIAQKSVPDYSEDDVTILDPKTLTFSYSDPLIMQKDVSASSTLDVSLRGGATIVWKFDEAKLKSELAGISKNAGTGVFATYNSISHAQAEVRPFWKTSFPSDVDDITIKSVIE